MDFTSTNGERPSSIGSITAVNARLTRRDGFTTILPAPTKILICPAACQNFGAGQLDIVLGCGTRPPPL